MNACAMPRAAVLLNPRARGGKGQKLYSKIESTVKEQVEPTVIQTDLAQTYRSDIERCLKEGTRIFIAAGGDGTVNALINVLAKHHGNVPLDSIVLGAIGLGSSNDFHKPFERVISGIPLKLSTEKLCPRDICRARFLTGDGKPEERYFTVSASMGLTAQANYFFNNGSGVLPFLKRHSTNVAILVAALRTIALHKNIPAQLTLPDEGFPISMSNLSLLKTPYVSGSFRYETPAACDNRVFGVNLCTDMTRLGLIRTLKDLAGGQFLGREGRHFWEARSVSIKIDALIPAALELDGEVFRTREVCFEIEDERIMQCQ